MHSRSIAPTPTLRYRMLFFGWAGSAFTDSVVRSHNLLHFLSTSSIIVLVCAPITIPNNDMIVSNHSTDLDSVVLSSDEGDVETPSVNELVNIPSKHAPLRRLSTFSKKYDVKGDGVLDAAEKAMRNMDDSHRGYLTNEKVYMMMQEHLETQNQLFRVRRIMFV